MIHTFIQYVKQLEQYVVEVVNNAGKVQQIAYFDTLADAHAWAKYKEGVTV